MNMPHRRRPNKISSAEDTRTIPKAIRLYEDSSGSKKLGWEEGPVGTPGPGGILILPDRDRHELVPTLVAPALCCAHCPPDSAMKVRRTVTALGHKRTGFRWASTSAIYLSGAPAPMRGKALSPDGAIKLPRDISASRRRRVFFKGLTA